MGAKLLEIDLRGRSLEEIMKLLQESGFTVSSDKTTMWDQRDKVLYGSEKSGPPVHVVWMDNKECSLLTVTIFNGKKVRLEPGDDLHLFDRPEGQQGQDWSVVRSLHVMA